MIRHGSLCRECKPGACVDCPTSESPLEIDCPRCGGKGCPECDDAGQFALEQCPFTAVPRHVFRAIDLADLYAKGLPPVAGGSLDQSAWFVELANFSFAEAARLRRELGIE